MAYEPTLTRSLCIETAAPSKGCGELIGYPEARVPCGPALLCTSCAPPPVARRQTVRKVACELRTEEGDVLLSGTFERCASDVVKRCKALFKGTGQVSVGYGSSRPASGKNAASFAWTIVGPDGAVRTRHAITVLS